MRFSIVIPTRERHETLAFTLRTCLDQSFDDYEIIVCDNCSSPATRRVVEQADSGRIRYIRSDLPLGMSDNWDLAVSHATGDYVTVLGDDDGLMPYALRELQRAILLHNGPSAVHWRRGLYTWPNITVESEADFLTLPVWRDVERHRGVDQILRVMRYEIGADSLPMIYNSAIRRDLTDLHRSKAGRVFSAMSPDVYSGIAFAYLGGEYITLSVPMNIAGLSGKSNGVALQMRDKHDTIAQEFHALHREAGLHQHPTTPAKLYRAAYLEDCFQHAKDLLFPDDQDLVVDRKKMVERYLAAIPEMDPQARAEIKRSIRESIADRPDLLSWFDNEVTQPPPSERLRLKPARFGFDGHTLSVDTTRFGVTDIAGAVVLATHLLGHRDQNILYNLPMPLAPAVAPAAPESPLQPEPPATAVSPPADVGRTDVGGSGLLKLLRSAAHGLRTAFNQHRA